MLQILKHSWDFSMGICFLMVLGIDFSFHLLIFPPFFLFLKPPEFITQSRFYRGRKSDYVIAHSLL